MYNNVPQVKVQYDFETLPVKVKSLYNISLIEPQSLKTDMLRGNFAYYKKESCLLSVEVLSVKAFNSEEGRVQEFFQVGYCRFHPPFDTISEAEGYQGSFEI